MREFTPGSPRLTPRLFRVTARAALLLSLLTVSRLFFAGRAQDPAPAAKLPAATAPLPQDSGALGLRETLRRLSGTGRLMQVTAHPDDEDGGMLTLEARVKGVDTLLMTLTRGEGGQNKVGSNLFDVLGVLRTLELLGSDRYYGVQQRFSHVADFGYSKTPQETFSKWQGHEVALADMVRVIRTFHPDVLVARFSGTDRDGHGHHQASAILAREAFRAAADPSRFPEQLQEGLFPWQPKKFYMGNVCGFGAATCPDQNWTVKLSTGDSDPVLGMSPIEFAMLGLKHQLSQGAGSWSVSPGAHYTFYKLVDSVLPGGVARDAHEQDFFDGIDTSLPGLAARAEADPALPGLRSSLEKMQAAVKEASATPDHGDAAAESLLSALAVLRQLIPQVEKSALNPAARNELLLRLLAKQQEFEQAAGFALGADLEVTVDAPVAASPEQVFVAVPGGSFELSAESSANSKIVRWQDVTLDLPPGWTAKPAGRPTQLPSGHSLRKFTVTVPPDAQLTRPYWRRDNPETDTIYTIDDPRYQTLPFPPPPVRAHATYRLNGNAEDGVIHATAMVRYRDSTGAPAQRPVSVAPPFSVALEPSSAVLPAAHAGATGIRVAVRSQIQNHGNTPLSLEVPRDWRAEPASQDLSFAAPGQTRESDFRLTPSAASEGKHRVKAVLEYRGKTYSEGVSTVTREDLGTFYYYQPAVQMVSVVDVKVPRSLKVGYIMGAGDNIPPVLQQIGLDLAIVPAETLSSADLGRFDTIVLGIRAYDTRREVADNNRRLLDYVSAGGTLIVQYNAGTGDFNTGKFTPFPAELSRARVSVEDAPVEILAPQDSIFHYPNQISASDFDGWVQERGLYFMDHWDDRFTPLLSCHDPGEPAQKGGLLKARYGKGLYIYNAYAFFRQLPAGVLGAVRLYVNLLAAGHEDRSSQAAGDGPASR